MRLDDQSADRGNMWVDNLLKNASAQERHIESTRSDRSYWVVGLVMLIFITISFITNIWGALIPEVQASFKLSLSLVGFIPTFLFLAYGLSLPVGVMVEKFQAKPVLLVALSCGFLGCILLAAWPSYAMALLSLFTIGIGFSMAQVVINPLLRVAGGEENYAFFGSMSQLVFAAGSAASPQLYAYLTTNLTSEDEPRSFFISALRQLVPVELPWIALYWVFCGIVLLSIVGTILVRMPRVKFKQEEKIESLATVRILLRMPKVWAYFFGIFCYVAVEQGVSNWISSFLQVYHQVEPAIAARTAVSGFWGAMTFGCLVNLFLLKIVDSRKILFVFMTCGLVTLLVALWSSKPVAQFALPLMGFWCAAGWPLVFSLALNSIEKHHGTFSGVLCTGIVGGAVMIPLVGKIGDVMGLKYGMLLNALALIYLIFLARWAKPIISNAVIGTKTSKV